LSPSAGSTVKGATGLQLALIAHTLFGAYVVLARYLFRSFPPFALLATTFGLGLLVMWPALSRRLVRADLFKSVLWVLAAVAVIRSVTKMVAVQYTLATTVQLIDLTAPIFTSILAWLVLRERMPPRTIVTLLATSLGAYLVITTDPFNPTLPNGLSDLIGIALALASSISMAMLIVLTGYLSRGPSNPANIYVQQTLALVATYVVLSIVGGEAWVPGAKNVSDEWLLLVTFVVVVTAGAWFNIVAIAKSNTILFSVLLSWRLVIAIVLSSLLLGEKLDSLYQVAGAVLVIAAISSYLYHQANRANDPVPGT